MTAWPRQARSKGVPLSPEQIEKLTLFADMVWDQGILLGLSGRKSKDEIFELDILDSLILFPYVKGGRKVLEIGGGAGFPGIVLKILFPETAFDLVEAREKAALFLERVVLRLGLQGVSVVWKRAEELARDPSWKGSFDIVLGRAVAPMGRFFKLAFPFAGENGKIVFQKGKLWRKELDEISPLLLRGKFHMESVAEGLIGEQKIIVVQRDR